MSLRESKGDTDRFCSAAAFPCPGGAADRTGQYLLCLPKGARHPLYHWYTKGRTITPFPGSGQHFAVRQGRSPWARRRTVDSSRLRDKLPDAAPGG